MANTVVVSSNSEVVALKAELAAVKARADATALALEEALKVKFEKLKIINSGANTSIISDVTILAYG